MDNANEPSDSPDEFYRRLTIGNSALSLRDRETAALAEYLPLKERLVAGDNNSFTAYQNVAEVLLDIKRQIHGSQAGYFDFLNEVTKLAKVVKDGQSNGRHMMAAPNSLGLWLAIELRRARAAFDKSRKDQDTEFIAEGMPRTGVRVKLTLKSASEICVALADATIAKAGEFQSTPGQISEAEIAVLAFTREIANSAIPLEFFVSGEAGLGGSAVKAATERGLQLYGDIEGAFALAKPRSSVANNAALGELLSILQSEAPHIWGKERDRINSEFAKAGRLQSGYHIRTLTEAAEHITSELLDRAIALASPETDSPAIQGFLSSLFSAFAIEIIDLAVGKSGRIPQPNNAGTAKRFTGEARQRIGSKIALWRLQTEISSGGQPTSPKMNAAVVKKSAGRPKGAGAIDDSLHLEKMAGIIAANPATSVRAAAKALEPDAAQPNSVPESTVRRLVGKFNAAVAAK